VGLSSLHSNLFRRYITVLLQGLTVYKLTIKIVNYHILDDVHTDPVSCIQWTTWYKSSISVN